MPLIPPTTPILQNSQRSSFALIMACVAIGFGIVADTLLKVTPWGINVTLITTMLSGIIVVLGRVGPVQLTGGGRWMLGIATVFAVVYAIRDTGTLTAFNLLAMLIALALAGFLSREGRIRTMSVVESITGIIYSAIHAALGAVPLGLMDARPALASANRGWLRPVVAVVVGILVALPLLLVFSLLFASADSAFNIALRDLSQWLTRELWSRVLLIGLWAWLCAGFLRGVFFTKISIAPGSIQPGPTLGIVEIGVALGLVNALFALFVVTQIPYFFGGASFVQSSASVDIAQYARRGFFELVTVAALALGMLLIARWLLRKAAARALTIFNIFAGITIALLFIIMASALLRMWLYTRFFGLTELRIYTTAFMAWIAITLTWFAVTHLRNKTQHFTFGAMVAGFGVLLALNLLNPVDLIVRTNVGRLNAGAPFAVRSHARPNWTVGISPR